ncbi:hypothetical protein EMIHUDRAFT_107054 [Emiliania huxleyi CCMP1516]|uniref:TRM5/TYW2-like N-terminal domain-containing protein n=2 Tax=Emiliania huxleyi TaxID=2903 RepID=A0A0D3I3S1_EMIH1|nr:hypothetical protein EMIHUDRAFT_107054 [Emiliania huxleyi CCMP1516]EOD05906.1 hypothetical protein EMIHUDRAFT_107054 [Emiliania huxleyi CCMP1516]|eukprot:XP_005758335.1 hypothetical protein EMIHUDRAFT_107054 [Emiliania huxleyi CCMP1516]
MTALDRALFSISLQLIALRIPARKCNAFMQALQGHAPCTTRLLLLDEGIDDLQLTKLPDELRDYVAAEGGEPVRHSVTIGYDKFSAEQVLRRLLPEGMEVPSAFEQVGHVAHMNLREEHLPYKALIGEVIAGDEDLETTVREAGRLWLGLLGPFPHHRGGCIGEVRENGATFALDYREDLNPQSAKWLRTNVLRNKAAGGAEAATSAAEGAGEAPTLAFGPFSHILMNLPASALEFLDALVGAFDAETWHAPLPRVHCYCFSKVAL